MTLLDQLRRGLEGSFTIERELGGGGMSRVFAATDRALNRKVALKVLPPELSAGINVERFTREIQLAATLQHPHIVPVFSAGEVDGMPYFTMPLVEGESLRDRLRTGALPVAEAVSILRDVCRALVYAHGHGVVHRDIKPDNVLLTSHTATVTDFGVAKAMTEATSPGGPLTATGMALGTPAYMAPEQAAAEPNVDARADIYAFGVLAFEMLTGQAPFAGRSQQQTLAAHMTEVPRRVRDDRPTVPPALSDLIELCLAKRPADRPQSAEEVLKLLEAWGTPTGGVTPMPVPASRGWRGPTIGAAAAVIVVLALWHPWDRTPSDTAATQQGASGGTKTFRPSTIVVAPFTNMTGDTSLNILGAIAAQTLSDGLSRLDSVTVMTPTVGMLDSTGKFRKFAGADAVRALGREAKAASVAWGSFQRVGDSLRFQAQVIDVNDGRIQITLDAVHGLTKNSTATIDELRDRLVTAIDATKFKQVVGGMGRAPSAAAYREFLLGVFEKWDNPTGTPEAALVHFEKASRLDTTFVLAAHQVVMQHMNIAASAPRLLRLQHHRSADSAARVLAARSTAAAGVDADLVQFTLANAHEDFAAQVSIARRLQARDSSLRMLQNIMSYAVLANRPADGLAALQAWGIERVPLSWVTSRVGTLIMSREVDAYQALGDYEAALAAARRWRKFLPGDSRSLANLELQQLAALGRVEDVKRVADSLLASFDWSGVAQPGYAAIAEWLDVSGKHDAAQQFREDALAQLAQHPPTQAARNARANLVAALLRARGKPGDLDSAQAIFTRLGANDSLMVGYRVSAAIAAAFRGDTATTRRALALLDSMGRDPFDRAYTLFTSARIKSAMGRKADAVADLTAAMQAGRAFNPDWIAEPAFKPLRDYGPFKQLLRPKG